jgi:flagellar biosynthesis protein FlhG
MLPNWHPGCSEEFELNQPHDQARSLRTPVTAVLNAPVRHPGDLESNLASHGAEEPPIPDAGQGTLPLLVVASGKGGVGKTFLAVNLAFALRAMGYRPLLVDMDWGLANVDVALGLSPTLHIGHVLEGECSLDDAVIEHDGVAILPNGCGQSELTTVDTAKRMALMDQLGAARSDRDILVFDTHPGIGKMTVDVARSAQATLIVSTPEPTALTDTYALFKVLGEGDMRGPTGVVINQAGSVGQAQQAARLLDSVAQRFLGHSITSWGYVLQDTAVRRAVQQQRAMITASPRAEAARLVRQIARTLAPLIDPGATVKPGPDPTSVLHQWTAGLGRNR